MRSLNRMLRLGETTLWSTVCISAKYWTANSVQRLFSIPRGMTGQGFSRVLSIAESNQMIENQPNSAMRVTAVSWCIYGGTERDRVAVAKNGTWAWEFNTTLVDGSPLTRFDLPPEFSGKKSYTRLAEKLVCPRDGTRRGILQLNHVPLFLPINRPFALQLNLGAGQPRVQRDTFVRFELHGVSLNAVEIT